MRHADLTRLDFNVHPRWRFVTGWEHVEPVEGDARFPKATLFAITVRGRDEGPIPGYLVGDPDDPAGLFLWLTDSSALFLNGRTLPRQDALDHLEAAFGIPRHSAFPWPFASPPTPTARGVISCRGPGEPEPARLRHASIRRTDQSVRCGHVRARQRAASTTPRCGR